MPFWTKPRMALVTFGLLSALCGMMVGHDAATGHWYRAMVGSWEAGWTAALLAAALTGPRKDQTASSQKVSEEEAYWSALLSRSAAPKKPGGF